MGKTKAKASKFRKGATVADPDGKLEGTDAFTALSVTKVNADGTVDVEALDPYRRWRRVSTDDLVVIDY